MSSPSSPKTPNDCGCCEGKTSTTPLRIKNRHGLSTIAYRTGDYNSFKDSMSAQLSSSDLPPLQRFTTRDSDDYSIALIDAWATVSDVLSFYQEYFANEGLLRTAKERLSLLEHARLVGYQLNPGVAASTFLAFTMDEPLAGTDNPVMETTIPAGSKVQSTPGPDETAQLFETETDIQARVDWNDLKPRLTQPQDLNADMGSAVLNGINTFVRPGDELLIVREDDLSIVKVLDVLADDNSKTTQLKFSGGTLSPDTYTLPFLPEGRFDDLEGSANLDGTAIHTFLSHSWKMEDIVAVADHKHWNLNDLMQQINASSNRNSVVTTNNSHMYGFHQRANLFGYNAQKRVTYNDDGMPNNISDWLEWDAADDEEEHALFLDNLYPEIVPGSYCLLDYGEREVCQVEDSQATGRTAYGLSNKCSRIIIADNRSWAVSMDAIRKATLLIQSEALELAQVPIDDPVEEDRILLDRADLYLRKQQYVAVSGSSFDQPDVQHSEVVRIKEVRLENGFTQLIFTTSLQHRYLRNTVRINANVALASHGESVSEIVGSGNAAVASQSFTLKQAPLTYTGTDAPSGSSSSLEIRVNDVLWQEVPTFLDRGSDEKIYTTKLDDAGITHVYFGNGVEGARLPSGNNNVIARYRKGIGLGGLVKENQLNLLLTRPLGVKGVMNPLASSGADDPETLDDARTNAPLGLLTLDRAVSLSDYEDFSRAFAGVSKARAVSISQQGVPRIFITVAGPDGAILKETDKTYTNLLSALQRSGDPYTHFSIVSYRPAYFKIDAGLYLHPDDHSNIHQSNLILAAARQAVRNAFSFEARSFNQPVYLSEVIRILQQVDGVIAVDVNHLYRSDSSPVTPPPRALMPVLSCSNGQVAGDELITLDPAPLDQLRVKS